MDQINPFISRGNGSSVSASHGVPPGPRAGYSGSYNESTDTESLRKCHWEKERGKSLIEKHATVVTED